MKDETYNNNYYTHCEVNFSVSFSSEEFYDAVPCIFKGTASFF